MTERPPPPTFFGLPRVIDKSERSRLEDLLRAGWAAQYKKPPSSLTSDLEALSKLFGAGATPKRLRETIRNLSSSEGSLPAVPSEVFLPVGDGRGLVTPEGRVCLEQLTWMRENGVEVVSVESIAWAEGKVAGAYRDWQRQWVADHVEGAGLRPGSFGFVLFLIVNGSADRESALRLPSDANQERRLAGVVMPVIDAFAGPLGGEPQNRREGERLRSNWRITQARAILYDYVWRQDVEGDAYLWVAPVDTATEVVATKLAARKGLDLPTLEVALRDLEGAYAVARPALSAFGAAHDRRSRTRSLLDQVVREFARVRGQ